MSMRSIFHQELFTFTTVSIGADLGAPRQKERKAEMIDLFNVLRR
jgi:hypothetical protein